MEIIKQQIDDLSARVHVKIAESDYAVQLKKELNKARQSAQVKGFRKGMAPMGLLKKMYGQEILVQELNKLMSEALTKFTEEEARLIGEPIPCNELQPAIDWDNQKDFEFVYEVGYFPEVDIRLESMNVPYYTIPVLNDEIEAEIESYRLRYGKSELADIVLQSDIVKVKVTGSLGEEPLEIDTQVLVKSVPEDQQAQFIDKKIGDVLEVEIRSTFPNEIDLSSMLKISKEQVSLLPSTLSFKIMEISRWVSAEINQELFDNVFGKDQVSSEEEFRARIKENAQGYYENLSMNRLTVDAQEALQEHVKMELPEKFVKDMMVFSNIKPGIDQAELEPIIEAEMPNILLSLSSGYITKLLLDENKLTVTEQEIVEMAQKSLIERLQQMGLQNFGSIDFESILKNVLQDKNEVNNLVERIQNEKIAQLFKEKAQLEAKVVTLEEYNKLYEKEDLQELKEEIISEAEGV